MKEAKDLFTEEIENFRNSMAICDYEQAKQHLESVSPRNTIEQRHLQHYFAQIHMYKGNYLDARLQLEAAIDEFGPNLMLLSDLAVCYYSLSMFGQWKNILSIIQMELDENKELISSITYVETKYLLAQFLEELADTNLAIEMYQNILELKDISYERQIRCKAQILRLLSVSGSVNGLGSLYAELIQVNLEKFPLNLVSTIYHSLFVAEALLVGEQQAKTRLFTLLENKKITEQYHSFYLYDFIDSMLRLNKQYVACDKLQSYIDSIQSNDPFDRAIRFLLEYEDLKIEQLEIEKLPLAGLLRTLSILIVKQKSSALRTEYIKRATLLLDSLSKESREIWNRRFCFLQEDIKIEIQCNFDSGYLHCGENIAKLSQQKKVIWRLLLALVDVEQISAEDAMKSIWQSSYNSNFYDRARVSIRRLNKVLMTISGEKNCIQISKDGIRVNPKVRFLC